MAAQKLMPCLCQDAQASFSSILALRLMAGIIASYWCSRCCHTFVPLLVTLMYSSKTVHQRIVRIRRSSSFSVKLRNSLLQTYGLQNSPDLNPIDYRMWGVMQDCVYDTPVQDMTIWSSAWPTHGTDYRRVSLMKLSTNGRRDLGPAWRKTEDISNTCCNNWTWTRLVVQLNLLCFRLCIVQQWCVKLTCACMHLTYFPR